jgi:hypothetical protein
MALVILFLTGAKELSNKLRVGRMNPTDLVVQIQREQVAEDLRTTVLSLHQSLRWAKIY